MNLEQLTRELEEYLAGSTDAVVLEDGAVMFDLREARYSLSEQHGKCLLHLWSPERNVVRRVLEVERAKDALRISVLRFGQARPVKLEICRNRDRRPPAAKKMARIEALRKLKRAGYGISKNEAKRLCVLISVVEDHVLAEAVHDERAELSRVRRRAVRGHRRRPRTLGVVHLRAYGRR